VADTEEKEGALGKGKAEGREKLMEEDEAGSERWTEEDAKSE